MCDKDKVNILLVDDQPAKLLTYQAILSGLDENLVVAHSAHEAFSQLLKNDFAVVLVDVCMPELDGYQLARMIRDHPRFEKTAIIFISAIYLSEIDCLRGYESGAVDYVPVPVIPEILRAKVKIFVELYRKTRDLQRLNDELESRVAERTAALQAANERLRQSEEHLRLASEAAEFGTYDFNFASRAVRCSPQMKRLLGCEAAGDLDFEQFLELVHPEDREIVRRNFLEPQGADSHRHRIEYRVELADGKIRWLLDSGRAFYDRPGDGRPVRVMGTVLDLTERKQVEQRQLLLMAELDHRVKNVLANVVAITKLSKKTKSVDDFVETLHARIQAMSKAHSYLRRDGWACIGLEAYIREILAPFISEHGSNIIIEGSPVEVHSKVAQSLALVFHELATNAVKYGSLSVPAGKVHIAWSRSAGGGGNFLELTWTESGGPECRAQTRHGFGVTVFKAVASELGADLAYELRPEGLFFSLKGPIEHIGAVKAASSEDNLKVNNHSFEKPLPRGAGPPVSARRALPKLRVLIVEDEAVIGLQIKSDLEKAGHKVVGLASNVAQGMNYLATTDFDVAFLDIRLGEELSTPVAERLLHRGIPFAFGTGFEDTDALPVYLKGIPRITKPYENGSIAEVIAGLVASPRRLREGDILQGASQAE